jgi:CopA family copper-resistance protein
MLGKNLKCFIRNFLLIFLFFCLSPPSFAQHKNHMALMPHAQKKAPLISHGHEITVNLVAAYKTVNFAGKLRKAIAVNNQIPAPTLHFKQGDHVTINVYNHLDKGTSIHWHGIILPWQMDGVEGVSQKIIPPGGVFHYRFTLRQSGTYWYHAHADVQEQEGLYGAFVIDPPHPPHYQYNKDYVVVLSDWSNTSANRVLANLKKEGDYYSPRFPIQPSLMKFIHDYRKASPEERKKIIEDYKMMQQMRMSIYDFSDVAYDAFLLNGKPNAQPWTALVKVGDVVRLRFIGASGSTIFHVKIPGAKIEMVHIQGNDVRPYFTDSFTIAPGETYDVLVKIKKKAPYIIYAESIDTVGKAYGALVTAQHQIVQYQKVEPFPEPEPVTREMMDNMMMAGMNHGPMNGKMSVKSHSSMSNKSANMPGMDKGSMNGKMPGMDHASMGNKDGNMSSMNHGSMKGSMSGMDHSSKSHMHGSASSSSTASMNMPTEPSIIGDTMSPVSKNLLAIKTSGEKYQNLIAAVKTNNPNTPISKIIRMELFGYMDRYTWFINGVPEYKTKPIMIEPGKRYRIIFTNNSMMRHPMHIHGHWFILRNGHGAYDPLLHTIEVPPGATAVADFDTDASGQWFFHCHHLYHMMSGMSRVFQYSTIINVANGTAKPETEVSKGIYTNRPIVRVDEVQPIDAALIHHPMAHPVGRYLASFLDAGEDPFHNAQRATFKGLYGGDYNKLELFTDDAEMKNGTVENADMDIFYWHLISQFWAIKGGANYVYRPARTPYWQPGIGIEGLMPYFIDTDIRTYYHDGSAKLDAEFFRDTQITNNFFIRLGIRGIFATKTVQRDEIGSGLNQIRFIIRPYYRLYPGVTLFTEFEHEDDYGALKNIRRNIGESTSQNTLTFGLTLLF